MIPLRGSAAAVAVLGLLLSAAAAPPQRPNLVLVLIDDFGWNNIGYHAVNQANAAEIRTPNMDALAAEGVTLDRHYVYRFCSPSRSSFQTGRNPVHVNTGNDALTLHNASDPISGFAGIPRNMTGIAEKLAAVGYKTVQAGKWHIGLATPSHTPQGRGYEQSLTYLDGANDYWTSVTTEFCQVGPNDTQPFTDLFGSARPAFGQNNSWACSQAHQPASCRYEDDIFTNFTVKTIHALGPTDPLFLYFAPHNCHQPLEVGAAQLAKFDFICASDPSKQCQYRQYYSAMVAEVDTHLGQVVDALKATGRWNNTLLVLSADNGGPIYRNGTAGANNWPNRGGKKSNWEGGVRVNAFATGGLIPASRRGSIEEGFIASEDWWPTFCSLGGVADPADAKAAAAGLPPIDGLNLWPLLSGANSTSPRTEVWLGSGGLGNDDTSAEPIVQGLIRADGYKVLHGLVIENTWTSAFYPNASTAWCDTCPLDCGPISAPTCLFNVLADPTEHVNLAAAHPDIVAAMSRRLVELQAGVFAPQRGTPSLEACVAGNGPLLRGFVGPFLP